MKYMVLLIENHLRETEVFRGKFFGGRTMIEFQCDYAEGAHPKILERMIETNMDQTPGYGLDPYCDEARRLIRKACGRENIDVQFLVGGTQTNTTIICSVLRPYQGVLTAASGHINVHESGAIEATGHKVLALPCGREGKITAEQIKAAYEAHMNDSSAEHMVQPGMVYISNPTENGTIYYRNELEAISRVCHECGLPLFLDGARLGYGLMAADNDVILEDIARLCDVFYIGGTKVGALFGEAVVITNPAISKDFRYMIKQRGGMLAKGRLLGIQFQTLFEDGLYWQISKHAIDMAMKLKKAFRECGYDFYVENSTNQQLPVLPDAVLKKLSEKYSFSFWEKMDEDHSAVRVCTSWATQEENIDALIEDLKKF